MERLLQVFISPECNGVYEVSVDFDTDRLICTCPGQRLQRDCKHVRWIKARTEDDGGYCVSLPAGVTEEDIAAATQSPQSWRLFVMKTFRAEVL